MTVQTFMDRRVFRWENPPPSRQHPRTAAGNAAKDDPWATVAAQLQLRAEQWAVVHEGDSPGRAAALAHNIRRGARAGFEPAGAFEAVTRSLGGGRHAVYARFVGFDDEWGMAS